MLRQLPNSTATRTAVPPSLTFAQLADEAVTVAAIRAWVLAQPAGTPLVTPAEPCLVATAVTAHLRDAGWDVRVSTSYFIARVRDQQGWLLAQPWFPADVHTFLALLDTAVQQNPAHTLSREACLTLLEQLDLRT